MFVLSISHLSMHNKTPTLHSFSPHLLVASILLFVFMILSASYTSDMWSQAIYLFIVSAYFMWYEIFQVNLCC